MHIDRSTLSVAQPRPRAPRRTVLLTGGSGVAWHARIPRMHEMNVICLTHRTTVAERPGVTFIQGDIREPRFGMSVADFTALARRVDAVIHSAAVTDFNRTDDSL